ncbi:MAG: adenosylcobinamide-GDP ribazoletransferase [Methanolinea sp.]|nr:adenosylcobinamide-GDP ribazoletransferase [Methanolinea sp.]
MWLNSAVALLQFTTILPLGKPRDFDAFAARSWMYPLAGYVTGGIAAAVALLVSPPLLAASLGIGTVFLVSGCNHLDGLMDFGDGLMAHGGREKRIAALTDRNVGAGALALGMSVTLVSFSSLASAACAPCALLVAEVGAKFSMALLSTTGKPFRDGLHAAIQSRSRPYFPVLAGILCLPLLLLPVPLPAFLPVAAAMVGCPLILQLVAGRLFGGVNGDVVGASHELTRAAVLAALALAW